MKTNKIIKSIVIVMLILTVCSFAVPAMADRGSRNESSRYGEKGKNETELSVTAEREMSVSGKAERKDGKNRPERPMDDDDDDRFEDRGKGRRHGVDFSELPEEPTDEEIVEFFKKYFMGNDPARTADRGSDEETGKDFKKDSRPFGRHKDCSCRSDDPADETAAEVPETATCSAPGGRRWP